MILTSMGPVIDMTTEVVKFFAFFYALFGGVIFLRTDAVFFAPFAHWLMHLMHIDEMDD